jgi:hypothetical protein
MIRVPTIGPLTPVSHALIGIALAGAGYHLVVHALGLPQFRGPLRIALVVAGIFIVCTILADGVDGPHEPVDDREPDGASGTPREERDTYGEPEKWEQRG